MPGAALPSAEIVKIRVGVREAAGRGDDDAVLNGFARLRAGGGVIGSDVVQAASTLQKLGRVSELASLVAESLDVVRASPPLLLRLTQMLIAAKGGGALLDIRRRCLAELIAVDPSPAVAVLSARALESDRRLDEAEAALKQALERHADAAVVRLELIRFYGRQRRSFEAAAVIAGAPIDGETTATLLGWATTLQRAFLFEGAQTLLAEADRRGDAAAPTEAARASLLAAQGHGMEAYRLSRAAYDRDGDPRELRRMCTYAEQAQAFELVREALARLAESGIADAEEIDEIGERCDALERQALLTAAGYDEAAQPTAHTWADHVVVGDHHVDFGRAEEAEASYRRAIAADRTASTARARLAALLLRRKRWTEAIELAESVLSGGSSAELLQIERECMRHTGQPEAAALSVRLRAAVAEGKSVPGLPQRIAVVGGSNTVMKEGWGRSFEAMAQRTLGITVDNLALGATSSIYGWYRIDRDRLFETHDLVLFEHSLNDTIYIENGSMTPAFREQVLKAIARECSARGKRFALILTCPRDNAEAACLGADPVVASTRRLAAEAGIEVIDVTEIKQRMGLSASAVLRSAYRDALHYTVPAATEFAAATLERLLEDAAFGRVRTPSALLDRDAAQLASIQLIPPEAFAVEGPHSIVTRESALYGGEFLRLERGGRLRVTVSGWLAGLMVNVTADTGDIRLRVGDRTLVKNIYAARKARSAAVPRVMLRQFGQPLHFAEPTEVEISMDVTQGDLERLPRDYTPYASPTDTPLELQAFEIAGLLIAR